jgi:hypothetical protein
MTHWRKHASFPPCSESLSNPDIMFGLLPDRISLNSDFRNGTLEKINRQANEAKGFDTVNVQ